MPLALALAKAIAVTIVMLAIGRYALRPLLHEAGASSELFTLTALLVSLAGLHGYRTPEAARTGLVLAQAGEFSVALIALAVGTGLFDVQAAQPVLAAIVVSMLVAPLLVRRGESIVEKVFGRGADEPQRGAAELAVALHGMRDHVVICGYGRVGSQLERILGEFGCNTVALDTDPARVKRGWDAGRQVFYGDASHKGVLEAAGAKDAKAIAITFDHLPAAVKALHEARKAHPRIAVLARASDQSALETLVDAGATEAVPETMEASLTLATRLLLLTGMPDRRVLERMQQIRDERYRSVVGS